MQRVLVACILALSVSWGCAQAELFAVVREGTLTEVAEALSGRGDLTRLVDEYEQDLLMYAAAGNADPEVVRYLVSLGFDVNRMTSGRWTPLMFAVRFNPEPAIAEVLLDLGASITVVNLTGERAHQLVPLNPNRQYSSHPVVPRLLPVQPVAAPPALLPPPSSPRSPPQSCCRVCRSGKACGDSCIGQGMVCSKGPGCACQGAASGDSFYGLVVAEFLDFGEVIEEECGVERLVSRDAQVPSAL